MANLEIQIVRGLNPPKVNFPGGRQTVSAKTEPTIRANRIQGTKAPVKALNQEEIEVIKNS